MNKNILTFIKYQILISLIFFNSCSQDIIPGNDSSGLTENTTYSINGTIQKGPFISGSSIRIQELDENLLANGVVYETTTTDNSGSFTLNNEISTRFVEVIATGFYFNEITGDLSNANITLRAIADLEETSVVNINILTTLEKERIAYLYNSDNMSFSEAKLQAEEEILSIFSIDLESSSFSSMDITKEGKSNAILLAITTILQINNSEAQLSELISLINIDIKEDGLLNSQTIVDEISTNATIINTNSVISNLESRYDTLGITVNIPDFYDYIDSDNDGILNGDEIYDYHDNQTSSDYQLDTHWMYYQPDYLELNGTIYSAFPDIDNNNQITVVKLENDIWTSLNINITKESRYSRIEADSNGNLYVFFYEPSSSDEIYYSDHSGILYGYYYDGIDWINILEENINNYFDDLETISFENDIYIIYGNTDDTESVINVKKFNNEWSNITPEIEIPEFVGDFSSTVDNTGKLYISYRSSNFSIASLEYSSYSWNQLETIPPDGLTYPHLITINNQLHIFSTSDNNLNIHKLYNGSFIKETYSSDIQYQFSLLNLGEVVYISSIEFTDNFGTIPTLSYYDDSSLTEIDLSSLGYSGMNGPDGVWFHTELLPYGIDSHILMYPNYMTEVSGLKITL